MKILSKMMNKQVISNFLQLHRLLLRPQQIHGTTSFLVEEYPIPYHLSLHLQLTHNAKLDTAQKKSISNEYRFSLMTTLCIVWTRCCGIPTRRLDLWINIRVWECPCIDIHIKTVMLSTHTTKLCSIISQGRKLELNSEEAQHWCKKTGLLEVIYKHI